MRYLGILIILLSMAIGLTIRSAGAIIEDENQQQTRPLVVTNEPLITGTQQKWHPLTLSFAGPSATEADVYPNPFLDYRLNVVFTAPSGDQVLVPGFFDGDGQGNGVGNVWRVRFAPDEVGEWLYEASFVTGLNVAVSLDPNVGKETSFDGSNGRFTITAQTCADDGFLKWGQLEYVGGHYLKFNDGPYWIKGGTNSPENLLAYVGFDNTVSQGGVQPDFLHEYGPHVAHWQPGDPNFVSADTGKDAKGLIGALNYLSAKHVNSIYFLPMNLGGDGQEVYPYISALNTYGAKTHFDISKLNQWNIVFDHAQRKGIALHVVLSETEFENERWLDDGKLENERKLFYREMIARFGYILALKWNLGEENDYSVSNLEAFAAYIQALDWAKHPLAVHTHLDDVSDYEVLLGNGRFTNTSFQYDNFDPLVTNSLVEQWRINSAQSNQAWVLDMDENFDSLTNANEPTLRKNTLYPIYFSGGNVEWYMGYHNLPLGGDLRLEDFSTRKQMWDYTWSARKFMLEHLPFWEMSPNDGLLVDETIEKWGEGHVFAKQGEVYAVYVPVADGNGRLDLRAESGSWDKRWYDPRTGQFEGDLTTITAGQFVSVGLPPTAATEDWVILVQKVNSSPSIASGTGATFGNDLYLPVMMTSCPSPIQ